MTKFCFCITVSTLEFFSAVLNSRRGKGWHVNWVAEIKNNIVYSMYLEI